MATETGRVVKRKRITLPGGGTVDIPVITQITFLDIVEQGQEYEFHVDNTSEGNRDIRVASIPGNGAATDESGGGNGGLRVERIDTWRVLDVVSRGQESFFNPDSKTVKEPPDAPPYFTTHQKTHIVKYIDSNNSNNWIKSELIDEIHFLDVVEQGQEKYYFLNNPPDNQSIDGISISENGDITVSESLDEISDAVDPIRTDPYQNIVDWSGKPTSKPPICIVSIVFSIGVEILGDTGSLSGTACPAGGYYLPFPTGHPPLSIVTWPVPGARFYYTFSVTGNDGMFINAAPGLGSPTYSGFPGTLSHIEDGTATFQENWAAESNPPCPDIPYLLVAPGDVFGGVGGFVDWAPSPSASGFSITAGVSWGTIATSTFQSWQNFPIGPPPFEAGTGWIEGNQAVHNKSHTLDCSGFTITSGGNGAFYDRPDIEHLIFHPYALVPDSPVGGEGGSVVRSFKVYMESQLGHEPGVPAGH